MKSFSFLKTIICVLLISISFNVSGQHPASGLSTGKDYSWFKGGRISVISSSHQDIAWMDSIQACIDYRDKMVITPALERMRNNANFKFSVEDALSLREYLQRHPYALPEILKYTKEGRLEWGATYKQPYESMYSGEALIRQAYFGRKWLKQVLPGCDFKTYWNEDVPGRSLQMAQILAKSGIPYMQFSRHKPGIYRWFSPDGSYVTCFSPGQYDEAGIPLRKAGTHIDSLTKVFTKYSTEWNEIYKKGNIAPELPVLYSHDFATPPDYDAFFAEWNTNAAERKKPVIGYATGNEWMDRVIKGDPSFTAIAGERPDVWLYIHGPSHQKALKASRDGLRLLTDAEKFATFDALQAGSFSSYPQNAFLVAWENSIYPDHGWGGKHGALTDRAFRTAFETGRDMAAEILGKSLSNIASRIKFDEKGIPLIVFNSQSWQRTDIASFTLDAEGNDLNNFALIDDKGNEVPCQRSHNHRIYGNKDEVLTFLFVAENIPPVGYRTYYLVKGKSQPSSSDAKVAGNRYENNFYKAEFAPGGLKSLFDKELGLNLLNTGKFLGAEVFTMQSVGNGAGEFTDVQQPTMEGFEKLSSYRQPWALISSGPVSDVWHFRKEINHVTVDQEIVFYKTIKRIDVNISLLGFDGERYREFRMAWPVNQEQSEVAYEVPMGVVRVGKDEISGAAGYSKDSQIYDTPCSEVHPREVQDWFSASDGKTAITISSDVAVFDWIDPTTDPAGYPVLQHVLLASRKSCHGEGNYYLQPGDHHYSFSLYSHKGDWKNGYRSGIQSNQPLRTITVKPYLTGGTMPETMSFISLENSNMIISTVKKCDDDDNVIVRFYEAEGKDGEAGLNLFMPVKKTQTVNMIEEEGTEIQGNGKSIIVKTGHNSIETLKLEME